MQVAELMEQKVAVQDALKTVTDEAEKFRLLGEIRSLTSKLYSSSGRAKVCSRAPFVLRGGVYFSRVFFCGRPERWR